MSANMKVSDSADISIESQSIETVLVESSEESSDSESGEESSDRNTSENIDKNVEKYTLIKPKIMENDTISRLKSSENGNGKTGFTPVEQSQEIFTKVGATNELTMEYLDSSISTDNKPQNGRRPNYNLSTITVHNLPESVNKNQVELFFSRYGHIMKIFYHHRYNHFQVEYMNSKDAVKALEVTGMKYKGSRIEVAQLEAELPNFNKEIVITNLSEDIGKDLLWETCEIFGPVTNIYFIPNLAFVAFENCESVELALAEGHVKTTIGHYLKLEPCNQQGKFKKPKNKKPKVKAKPQTCNSPKKHKVNTGYVQKKRNKKKKQNKQKTKKQAEN